MLIAAALPGPSRRGLANGCKTFAIENHVAAGVQRGDDFSHFASKTARQASACILTLNSRMGFGASR